MNYYISLIPVLCFGLWYGWKLKTDSSFYKFRLDSSEKLIERVSAENNDLKTKNQALEREADLFKFLLLFLKEKESFEFKKIEEKGIKPEEWVFVTTQRSLKSWDIEVFSTKERGIVAHANMSESGFFEIYSTGRNKIQFKGEYPTTIDNVKNQFIGAGYGTVLMHRMIKLGKSKGVYRIYCDILETDDKKHKKRLDEFYNKFGFTPLLGGGVELNL